MNKKLLFSLVLISCILGINFSYASSMCGSSNNQSLYGPPSANLCNLGTSSEVKINSTTFDWECTLAEEIKENCSATQISRANPCGSYGDADNSGFINYYDVITAFQNLSSLPLNIIDVNNNNSADYDDIVKIYNYLIGNINTFNACSTISINGKCGSSSSQYFYSQPTVNLCDSGTASNILGMGPWYWTCSGENGGPSVICYAFKTNYSTSAAVYAVRDKTRPTIYITSPSYGSTVSGIITLSANATDNVGVASVQFLVDRTNFGSKITTPPYEISLDTKTLKNGYHYISATAKDAAGNTRTSALIRIRVNNPLLDTTLPNVSITSPTNGQTVLNTITLSANATDNIGVVGVQFMLDGTNYESEDVTSPYQVSLDTKTLNNGSHTVSAIARDAAGNTKTSSVINFTVNNPIPDTINPIVSITSPSNGSTVSGIITLSANATDNVGVVGVQFLIDGNNINSEDTIYPYQTSVDTNIFINGSHAIAAIARDAAGNTAQAEILVNILNTIPEPEPEENLIPNPSFENSDSLNNPIGWLQGNWGTNTAIFTYPVTGYDSTKAAKVELTQHSDGDAKWYFTDVNVLPNESYKFSDNYQSNIESSIVVRYTLSDNSFVYKDIVSYLPASINWTSVEKTFTTPANVKSLTIFHLIGSVGYLNVDNYYLGKAPSISLNQGMVSLNFDDGYLSTYNNALPILNAAGLKTTQYIITDALVDPYGEYVDASQVLEMQAQGHEIGAHTKTHPHLTTLSLAELEDEVAGSKQELLNIGVNQVNTFSYPYGEFNDTVVNTVKNAGYLGARNVEGGFNDKSTDKYLLESLSVESNTSVNTVKSWIDSAVQNKTWLILVLHRTENNGGQYSVTPDNLQQIVDYLVANNVLVVTNAQGIQMLSQ